MIISMTGFGQSVMDYKGKKIRAEIKSLNSRTNEVRCRMPNTLRDKEMDVRKWLTDVLQRGKIDLTLTIEEDAENNEVSILNHKLFKKYFKELQSLKTELGIESGDILQSVLRIPNVMGLTEELADEDEWKAAQAVIEKAIVAIQKFRMDEGQVMMDDMVNSVKKIEFYLKEIEPFEGERLQRVRDRLRKSMDDFLINTQMDQNRFEQEIIYYIEKLDINEEKIRLAQHCTYFLDELNNNQDQKGKKLGFITQEMGREINTLGAKAQDSDIQLFVVNMKDELEKLKELLANIL